MDAEHYFEHLKTGKIYRKFILDVIDATNATDGRAMALYQNYTGQIFVRDAAEFAIKFKPADDQQAAKDKFKKSRG